MSRAWWDSLTDKEKEAHSYRSALGIAKKFLSQMESAERNWGSIGPKLLEIASLHEEGIINAEWYMAHEGFPLELIADYRATRERLVALRVRQRYVKEVTH